MEYPCRCGRDELDSPTVSHMPRPRNPRRTVLVGAQVPEEVADQLAAMAKERRVSIAVLVRQALADSYGVDAATATERRRSEKQHGQQEKLIA